MNTNLEQSILRTLAYFDLFSHPLTREEVYKWLWGYTNIDCTDFVNDLNRYVEAGVIDYRQGFYFLPGKVDITEERQRRIRLMEDRLKVAVRGLKKLRYLPFVRAVFVCNTLAMGTVTSESDVDVLVVAKEGRIWLARFFSNLVLKLFRLRTGKRGSANKICLSFFLTEDNLNLESTRIVEPDIYMIYWLVQLLPIYDPHNIRKKILDDNSWTNNFVSDRRQEFSLLDKYKVQDSKFSGAIKKILENMWNGGYGKLLEDQARGSQIVKMKIRGIRQGENKNIIINDSIIKLHENDRREEYQGEWIELCEERLKD
ncbi:hypothetical protein KJ641_00325 [Patescibacteria group bacterium]|nr:hypothetical protein [Patescibacteria group bacterium]MBU1895304.1 hypothetical protein [Patescibacteria group bacterium]